VSGGITSSIIVMCGQVKQCSVRCNEWMRVRSTVSICALVASLMIAKVFGGESEDTGLPYAGENIGAGSNAASISG